MKYIYTVMVIVALCLAPYIYIYFLWVVAVCCCIYSGFIVVDNHFHVTCICYHVTVVFF